MKCGCCVSNSRSLGMGKRTDRRFIPRTQLPRPVPTRAPPRLSGYYNNNHRCRFSARGRRRPRVPPKALCHHHGWTPAWPASTPSAVDYNANYEHGSICYAG